MTLTQNEHDKLERLEPHYGGAVSGHQFWPRPDIVDDLVETLKSGESISLFGLRRIGKSSAMEEAARILQSDAEYVVVYIDAQDFNALEKLLTGLMAALPSDGKLTTVLLGKITGNRFLPIILKTCLKAILNRQPSDHKALAQHVADYWGPICQVIADAISESDVRLILMIDEFPYMCKGMLAKQDGRNFVDKLLATFRQWRNGLVAMVLSGSIGMRFLAREHNLGFVHLNDLVPIEIPPLESREEARNMVEAMVRSTQLEWWNDETTEVMLDETAAYYPSFLQFAFDRLKVRRAATKDKISEIFAEQIRPRLDVTFFDQFDERMKRYDPPLQVIAKAILRHLVSVDSNLVLGAELINALDVDSNEVDFTEALKILKEDGFLGQRVERDNSEHWRLASPLVKAWWLQRHGPRA